MSKIREKRGRSIFRMTMLPLLILLVVEMTLLAGGLLLGGIIPQLDRNAEDILGKQLENRKNYLQNTMISNWADLSLLTALVNRTTQEMLDEGELSLENLDSDSDACAPLLLRLSDELIATLYAKKISGIYLIFNTQDLAAEQNGSGCVNKTGISIRDGDPSSTPSIQRADLLLERAPIAVVQGLNISTDSGWLPMFPFGTHSSHAYHEYLYHPYQAAYAADEIADAADFGYWSATPYTLPGTTEKAISYSVPLVLEDGTVYGVLGIELMESFLRELLPSGELADNKQGSYLLAVGDQGEDELHFSPVLVNGATLQQANLGGEVTLTPAADGGYTFTADGYGFYADVEYISLYNTNTPFESEHWALVSAVRTSQLYVFSRQVTSLLILTGLLMLMGGALGSVLISRRLSRPIRELSEEVDRAWQEGGDIPQLTATGIAEIDLFSDAITTLSRNVVTASTRFLRIMDMASVELGGFELREGEEKAFVTDNFFPLLGWMGVDTAGLNVERFRALRQELQEKLCPSVCGDGSLLFRVPLPQGGLRYVRVEVKQMEEAVVGLAEDVTNATLERLRIEHDRDYDLLTGLLNRRAFYRAAEELFKKPEVLGHAALLMLDLDNLKSINDRFGHDWGDQYIRQAGQCFSRSVPGGTLCARVSGDEFFLVFAGYDSREAIRYVIDVLGSAIRGSAFALPDGEMTHICASGGISWYPEDSGDFSELMKFADFAMYQMKQTQKGQVGDFDLGVYNQESFLVQNRRELLQLLEEQCVQYYFQPIMDARTGAVRAYEALMRVDLPTLRSPETVLKLARELGRLHDVERLTWFKSNEAYQALLNNGQVDATALLFINSIASQCMTMEDQTELGRRYQDRISRMVIEITEGEDLDPVFTNMKREAFGGQNMLALDDYGSGYNSEKNLLEISPQFIKVDISIIRDIDKDPNKQAIVSNIVGYAHERDMGIIAEGLETAAEVEKVLALGVDLLQGYFLARPGAVPPQTNQVALDIIADYWNTHT